MKVEKDMPLEETAEKKPPRRKKLLWIVGGVVGGLAVACAVICAVAAGGNRILNHTSVLGVDMSGLTREQAIARWQEQGGNACKVTVIPLTVDGEETAEVSLEELGRDLFSADATEHKSAGELLRSDFKEFHIAGQVLGVGQITCIDSLKMLERREEFLTVMQRAQKEHGYDMTILMFTDVLKEGSQLLFVGNDDTIRRAFDVEPKDNTLFLPGVMSRKKQIIPMLTALWG